MGSWWTVVDRRGEVLLWLSFLVGGQCNTIDGHVPQFCTNMSRFSLEGVIEFIEVHLRSAYSGF